MKRKLSRRERIQYIHDRITGKLPLHAFTYLPGYWAIAQELGVSMPTIQADAAFMRDELGLPIAYDEQFCRLYYRGGDSLNQTFDLADTLAAQLLD